MKDSPVVAPFEATTTPAKRKLVMFAVRTAIDAVVAHAADEAKPIGVFLVVEVMNLLASRDRVWGLHSLRLTCKLTRRGSFPVPGYPLLELPTGVLEAFVGGSRSRHVSFEVLSKALALHREEAVTAAALVATAAAAEAAAAEATAADATAAVAEATAAVVAVTASATAAVKSSNSNSCSSDSKSNGNSGGSGSSSSSSSRSVTGLTHLC
jgi:hypothetical protein